MSDPTNKPVNAQDLEKMNDAWSDYSSRVEFACDRAIREAQDHAYKLGYERGVKDTTESANMACDLFAAGQKLAEEAGYARGLKHAAAQEDQNAEGSGS